MKEFLVEEQLEHQHIEQRIDQDHGRQFHKNAGPVSCKRIDGYHEHIGDMLHGIGAGGVGDDVQKVRLATDQKDGKRRP
mgnify:CR=1 FL=1